MELSIATRTAAAGGGKRAVKVKLLPFEAKVTAVYSEEKPDKQQTKGGHKGKQEKASASTASESVSDEGMVGGTLVRASAPYGGSSIADEQFLFSVRDVVDSTPSSSSSSSSSPSFSVGDIVEVSDIIFDSSKRQRRARQIKFVRAGEKVKQLRSSISMHQRRATATGSGNGGTNGDGSATAASTGTGYATARFAKGPDSDNAKGFTSRRSASSGAVASSTAAASGELASSPSATAVSPPSGSAIAEQTASDSSSK